MPRIRVPVPAAGRLRTGATVGGLKALLLFTHSDSQLTAARLRTWADMVARCFCEWTPTVSGTSGISV